MVQPTCQTLHYIEQLYSNGVLNQSNLENTLLTTGDGEIFAMKK